MQPLQLITKNIRILLIDDQTIVRAAMRMLIESRPGLKVIGEGANRTESLALATSEQPEIILFALNEASIAKQARLVILTGLRDPKVHQRAVRLGATGVVLKDMPAEDVVKAIEKVHSGEVWLNRSMTASVLAGLVRGNGELDLEAAKIVTLTKREREICTLIGEGLKNKQIAARLFISDATVRHHLTSIFDKLDVSDRLELIIYVYRHGLSKPPT